MQYTTSTINVNGVFRELLIVSSDTPVEFPSLDVIIHSISDSMELIYYTDGLYRELIEDGKYYYWFLLRSKVSREINAKLVQEIELLKADDISAQQYITDLELVTIEQGQQITDLELMIMGLGGESNV